MKPDETWALREFISFKGSGDSSIGYKKKKKGCVSRTACSLCSELHGCSFCESSPVLYIDLPFVPNLGIWGE